MPVESALHDIVAPFIENSAAIVMAAMFVWYLNKRDDALNDSQDKQADLWKQSITIMQEIRSNQMVTQKMLERLDK